MAKILTLPCGHLCTCESCIKSMKLLCPICRESVRGYVTVKSDLDNVYEKL